MSKICLCGTSMVDAPLNTKKSISFFEEAGIEFSAAENANLIISGTFTKILASILKFGSSKKYLIWTIEPRFNKFFNSNLSYPFLPEVHIMNVYTGIFDDNYFFVPMPLQESRLDSKKTLGAGKRKVVSLMTYQSGRKWKFRHKGVDLDLCNLRTKIALEGHSRGLLDIYGRAWPKKISQGQSRGEGWRDRKMNILKNYNFTLCFENTNWPYYCTEKIWDAIKGGCLPIYYGKGNNIYEDFPKNSFLDYHDFNDANSLFDYIQNIKEEEFRERMLLCIKVLKKAFQYKQEKNPYQRLLDKTLLKIKTILQ